MNFSGWPKKQGLYDPQFEHDTCGIGFIAHIKGEKSHALVRDALAMLCQLEHRGGQGDEPNTGDGAGILLQVPHLFLSDVCAREGITLPEAGAYGVGMLFLPQEEEIRQQLETLLEEIITQEGQTVLGWRTVPVDDRSLGRRAKDTQPFIRQIFIGKSDDVQEGLDFERRLYVIRKQAEKKIGALKESGKLGDHPFYVASLSSRTIVYKGMLTAPQLSRFYLDLQDERVHSAVALVHSRYSTNTFPSWERAHPNRYIIHNGEFNTLRGNVNWMRAREAVCHSPLFDMEKIRPIIDEAGSDSAMFDNALEFLTLSGRSLAHALMMMIPEPWEHQEEMDPAKRAFYEYHSCLMEPWDGPAAIAFTDGTQVGACLDRNGLRPARYCVTKDDRVILSSEAGALKIPEEQILVKERLHPGQMLLIDLNEGRIISDQELKGKIAGEQPYQTWLNDHLISLEELSPAPGQPEQPEEDRLVPLQNAFGYTVEELEKYLAPMVESGDDPIGSMGYDAPLAVLSRQPQLLYNYFKQQFAQVTNPPIDAIREEMITSVFTTIGGEGNLLDPRPESARRIRLKTPLLTDEQLAALKAIDRPGFKAVTLPILFPAKEGEQGLQKALDQLFTAADQAIAEGANLLILSDRGVDQKQVPIPALLAVSGLHHHLIRQGTRTKASLLLESGEPRQVHHFCLLLGYGADGINPYLAFQSIAQLVKQGTIREKSLEKAIEKYIKAGTKGIVKVMSKMGISAVQSYKGAQIFEAIGIGQEVIDRYFTGTVSRLGGIDLEIIAKEALLRHERGFSGEKGLELDPGDDFQYRRSGETEHLFEPKVVHQLQKAVRENDYEAYKKYAEMVYGYHDRFNSLRGLLQIKPANEPVPLEEVEPVESILRRFKTGAMSYGALSQEAHEALAIAMNRIGGKSNSGEGGEDPARFVPDENGDLRRSAIKQVASGRFGVTSYYLTNADEIQIKMAQGAKPGEGGQLPGHKVYPWIAKVRGATPGVELISPPPHHDIYSIEDLAQLIYDLKNANPSARISVKLVSVSGVGTIAAGVAKGRADTVLISGYDGGTGAAPKTSIKHAGLPWEIGLAETQQTLILNNLRDRITVETDGKLMTGRDVIIAALLGAEEFGFSTAPLVSLGCVMARVCHLNTCPVGVASQDPKWRKRFKGDPQHVVNFMRFVAQEVREWMAKLGVRTFNELIGRTDLLEQVKEIDHWKAKTLDLSPLLYQPKGAENQRFASRRQDHGLDQALDHTLIRHALPALQKGEKIEGTFAIQNTDRATGTMLGHEVTKRYGEQGLPDDTICFHFHGSAGQSFGAFLPKGITLTLEGEANDYFGKGLSGGKLVIFPPSSASYKPEENIIIGNVALYGATGGEAYIRGVAGERFCVRNSGAQVVVEGVGDHACEYMTGGRVVILGPTGKNFAAGMSGGIAYVYDRENSFRKRCNTAMVNLQRLEDEQEIAELKALLEKHLLYTGSTVAQDILTNWDEELNRFIKVIPKDYERMIKAIAQVEREQGLKGYEAALVAFETVIGGQDQRAKRKVSAVSR